jgi:hypothetical protein
MSVCVLFVSYDYLQMIALAVVIFLLRSSFFECDGIAKSSLFLFSESNHYT